MLNYSSKSINTITLCVTLAICVILFVILDFCFLNIPTKTYNQNISESFVNIQKSEFPIRKDLDSIYIQDVFLELMQVADIYEGVDIRLDNAGTEEEQMEAENTSEVSSVEKNNKLNYKNAEWRIEIPKIGLIAPIKTGTTQDILATAVGHFEGNPKWNGNVALAGHNRGYNCNFFEHIKELKEGDKIIYYTNKGKREYKVVLNKIIKQTDWSYVENTDDNRITLITCVENMFEYRRCVQAVEII